VLQNGATAATVGYSVSAAIPNYSGAASSGSNAAMRLEAGPHNHGMLLNAASATSDVTPDVLHGSEVGFPAAVTGGVGTVANVTPVISAADHEGGRRALQTHQQVRSFIH